MSDLSNRRIIDEWNKEWNLFRCLSCENKPEFTPKEIIVHLETVHNITKMTGIRNLICHLDGKDFYQDDFSWEVSNVKLTQQIRRKRRGESKRLWEGYIK